MRILQNIPLKNKIVLIIFIIGTLSAITGGAVSYFYEINKSKSLLISNTMLQAKLLSDYCGLPLEFNYPENASDVLQKLHNLPNIYDGILFTTEGKIFAFYRKFDSKIKQLPEQLKSAGYFIENNFLHMAQPVIYKEKNYGTLYLRSYMDWKTVLMQQIRTTLLVVLSMLFITIFLAYRFQKSISKPIIGLTQIMNHVALNKDYSVRFSDSGTDEIGKLYIGFNSMISEISAREIELKKTNESLKFSEERFRNLIDRMPFPIAIVELNGSLSFWNDSFVKTFGYSLNEISDIEDWWYRAYPNPEYRNWAIENWELAVKFAREFNTAIPPYEYEVTCLDGSVRIMEISGIVTNENFVGTFIDLTERKLAEEKLRESERRFSDMANNVPGVIFQFEILRNLSFHFLYVSPKIAEIFQLPYDPNQPNIDFERNIHHDDLESFRSFLNQAVKNTEEFNYEGRINTPKGIRWFQSLARPIKQNSKTIYNGIIIDITDRKEIDLLIQEKTDVIEQQNEEYQVLNEELIQTNEELVKAKTKAEESDSLKTSFLQNMSHEIRTPMNAIMGFSELLVEQYNNKAKLEYYSKIILERCSDLLNIINDILEISKIESGQLPLNIEICNLRELVGELSTFFTENQKKSGKRHIHFELKCDCNANNCLVLTDKVKLRQILINLVGNAFKFTDNGSITGNCRIKDDKLQFTISDTGIGIPADKHKMIFERFIQVNQYNNRLVSGTGLGLSIVKGLVNLLGGDIWLESEPGKGTTFYFNIPFNKAQIPEYIKYAEVNSNTPDLKLKHILIVEDDYFNAEYLKEILLETEAEVSHVSLGTDALKLTQNKNFDIILMDIRLPDTDGYTVTKQILKQKPGCIIIAQTAYASNEEKEKALKAGCSDYISKPIKKDNLLKLINKIIS